MIRAGESMAGIGKHTEPVAVRTKCVYDPPAPEDGKRVLVTRYWPRGVSRSRVDEYVSALAPSRALLRAYRRGEVDWERFRESYLTEMGGFEAQDALRRLAVEACSGTITLLCTCRSETMCHRTLLRGLVAAAACSG